ncbi:MAG: hypothetical protein ACOYJS_03825 [Acutalibacteraceae bacterium]
MNKEKTLEELKIENNELKNLLSEVIKKYDLLGDELRKYRENQSEATVSSVDDIKKLLKKYSRL